MARRSIPLKGVSLLMAGALGLSACSLLPGSDPAPKPTGQSLPSTSWQKADAADLAQGGALRLAVSQLPTNFNPQHADGAMSDAAEILSPTSGGAVRITEDGGWQVDPDYARSVKVTSKDPLTIEVKLNPDAVWQGGTPITAKDMVAFWKAQNGDDEDFIVSSTRGYEDIADIKTGDDPYAYDVEFETPTAEWPRYISPRLPATVSKNAKTFNSGFTKKAPSSNGPFMVTSIEASTGTVTEEPNPRWWGKKPQLTSIVWRTASPAVQAKAYVADELDAVRVSATTYDSVRRHGQIQQAAGTEWSQLTLNGARGPLKVANVRRAVARAIDRDKLADAVAQDFGLDGESLGSLVYVPGQLGYKDSSAGIGFDRSEAKRLLAKAGYKPDSAGVMKRKGKTLTLTMPVPADTPTNSQRAEAIKRDLKAVGIVVELKAVPAKDFFTAHVVALDFDLVTFAWNASAFPIAAARARFNPIDSSQNFTGLDDGKVDASFATVLETLDDSLRFTRVATLDRTLLSKSSMVPLGVTPKVVAVDENLRNYGAAQFEQPDWTIVGFLNQS